MNRTFEPFQRSADVVSVDEENRTIDYVASTEAVDSYDEVVAQNWTFDRFAKNPVILFHHGRSSSAPFPVGRGVDWGIHTDAEHGQHLRIRVQFAPKEVSQFADETFRMVKAGYLKGGSVGFVPRDVRMEKRDGKELFVLDQNELWEFSVTPLGANPEALALSADDRENHRARLKSMVERTANQEREPSMPQEKAEKQGVKDQAPQDANVEIDAALADIVARTAERDEARARVAELENELSERDASLVERDKSIVELEAKLAESDVDSYIGKKLTPAERSVAVEDRIRLGAEKFAERMELRADLSLTSSVLGGADPDTNKLKSADRPGEGLVRRAMAAAEKG